jgi:MFS family permease
VLLHRIAVKIAFFINGFIYASWVSRLPEIQKFFHADNGTIGLVLLASSVGAVGAMPFTGWIIIKNGSRRVTLISAILYCAIVPLIPFMPGVMALIILFFLMGIVTGMLDVAMNAQAVMVEQQYQKPIMTSFHAFFSIGMALGAWAGALFVDLDYNLFNHFIIVVILALIAVLWGSRHLIQDKPDQEFHHEGPLFRLPSKALISVGIIAFCCMMGEGAMGDWSVNYMQNIAHASKALAPIGLSAFATAMTLGRIFGDRARAKFGDRKMIMIGGIISTAGLSIALAVPMPFIVIGGFFLVGLGLSTIVPIAYSLAGNAKGLPSGVGLAMVTTVGYSGFLFGPPIIGFLADWQTLRVALLFVALLLLIMTMLGVGHKTKSL